ncbi:hypothetical protein UT300019_03880 [Clostridium sp. CTA-19]
MSIQVLEYIILRVNLEPYTITYIIQVIFKINTYFLKFNTYLRNKKPVLIKFNKYRFFISYAISFFILFSTFFSSFKALSTGIVIIPSTI